ncbi:hypothetical protein R3P38DRAFT_2772784 [Favolaschia claudopus]|uniref:Uncharacterized protein n=1 Tax=Favolaschia claudopus TaxID=2862362 RepID=A0AAW0C5I0_9AGAR
MYCDCTVSTYKIAKSVQDTAVSWTPSKTLDKTLRAIINAAFLMPNIAYYGSSTLPQTVITVARASGSKDLPEDDVAQDILLSWIGDKINNARYQIKKMITESLIPASYLENIAELARDLLKAHAKQFKPTLGLYLRLALIRSHIPKNHQPKQFWRMVDDDLEGFAKMEPETALNNLMTLYYEDTDDHGDPAKSSFKLSEVHIGEQRPKWYQPLHDQVSRVQRVEPTRAKRKRDDDDDEDEEDGEGEGQGEGEEHPGPQDDEHEPDDVPAV